MNLVNFVFAFIVALVVSVLVYWVATAVFHLVLVVAGLDLISLLCFVLFLGILFGAPSYFAGKFGNRV